MPPPRTRLDPDGYYTRLGLEPTAGPTDIVKAYRQKARVLHPDVPDTGNANAFVAVKQAYDILSNQSRGL
jgi:molecular chaperone DnaJ